MPSFEVSFEVFCGTCNAGLCNSSTGRNSYGHSEPQVVVEVCSDCMDNLRNEMQALIDELVSEVNDLRGMEDA